MDAISCELILIDTSKSEEIHNLLLTYTDKVYEFEWCKDFAKARNEGVRRAKGEWYLYLDDDEWFVDVQELIDFFHSGKYKHHEYANILVRNYMDVEYTIYSDAWCTRLFYLGGGAEFNGKVHEQIINIHGKPVYLQAIANHSGYVYETDEQRRAHFERNKQILDEVLKENPDDLRLIAHLVQEYRSVQDWDAMIELCRSELQKSRVINMYSDLNHYCTLYAGMVEAYTFAEKRKEALEICEIGLTDEKSTDLLKALLHLYTAMNYTQLKEWKKANAHIYQYFDSYEHFQKNKESMNIQLGAALIHRVFDKNYIETASNILVYSALKINDIEIPFAIPGLEERTEMDIDKVIQFIEAMAKLVVDTKFRDVFTEFLNNIVNSKDLRALFCGEVRKLEEKDESAFQKVAYELSKTNSDFWYVEYCRVIEADARENRADVEHAIETLLNGLSIVCHMPDRVYGIIDKYDIKVAKMWDKVVGDQWTEHANKLVNHCEDVYIDKAYDYLLDVYEESDWRVVEFLSAFQEKVNREQRRGEMNALRTQVLEQVKSMLASDRKDEAAQIVAQLKLMFPNDDEIEALLE